VNLSQHIWEDSFALLQGCNFFRSNRLSRYLATVARKSSAKQSATIYLCPFPLLLPPSLAMTNCWTGTRYGAPLSSAERNINRSRPSRLRQYIHLARCFLAGFFPLLRLVLLSRPYVHPSRTKNTHTPSGPEEGMGEATPR